MSISSTHEIRSSRAELQFPALEIRSKDPWGHASSNPFMVLAVGQCVRGGFPLEAIHEVGLVAAYDGTKTCYLQPRTFSLAPVGRMLLSEPWTGSCYIFSSLLL